MSFPTPTSLPHQYLNSLLPPTAPLQALDSTLNSLSAHLNLTYSNLNANLDNTLELIQRSLPRLEKFDLEIFNENIKSLESLILELQRWRDQDQFAQNSFGTRKKDGGGINDVLSQLEMLSTLLQRLTDTREILREASSWSTLESEVTGLISEGLYLKAAERLEEVGGNGAGKGVQEMERLSILTSLKNQLEASVSSALVAAASDSSTSTMEKLNDQSIALLKTYFGIFMRIGRVEEFWSYYFGIRKISILKSWEDFSLSQISTPESKGDTIMFPVFLSHYHHQLIALLSLETRTHLPEILSASVHTVNPFVQVTSQLLIPILHSVQTETKTQLDKLLNVSNTTDLKRLLSIFRERTSTSVAIERIINPSSCSLPPAQPPLLRSGSSSSTIRRSHYSHSQHYHHRQSIATTLPTSSIAIPATPTSKRLSFSLAHSRSRDNSSLSGHARSRRQASIAGIGSLINPTSAQVDDMTQNPSTDEEPSEWEVAFLTPFFRFMDGYIFIEKSFYRDCLPDGSNYRPRAQLTRRVDADKTERVLGPEKSGGIWAAADESWDRCLEVTRGWGVVKWLESVIDAETARWMESLMMEMSAKLSNSDEETGISGHIEGLEYKAKDWDSFKIVLESLRDIKNWVGKRMSWEKKISVRIIGEINSLGKEGAKSMGITQGAMSILKRSVLLGSEINDYERLEEEERKVGEFLEMIVEGRNLLLVETNHKEKEFTTALQNALHSRILRPLKNHLKAYPSLPIFTSNNPISKGEHLEQLPIPTFSLSPSETISQVADGLLNLPRLFEIYHNEEDALGWEVDSLPFLKEEREFEEEKAKSHRRVSRLGMLEEPSVTTAPEEVQQHAFASHLMSLTISLIYHLLANVLPLLPYTLPPQGAEQLAVDLGYLGNVVRALDLEVENLGQIGEDYEMWRKEAENGRRWRKH